MHMKALAAALMASALIAAPALAQSQPPAQSSQPAAQPSQATASSATLMQKSGQWRASKLVGLNVYNNNNEKIGDINELILDQSGKIDLVVIGVGGFLGMGEHRVALPFSQIKFSDQPRPAPVASTTRPAGTDQRATTGTAAPTLASANRDYPDHALLNMSKDQLKALPAFRYASEAARAETRPAPAGQEPAQPQRTTPVNPTPQPQR